jgi:hypothetical protein
MDRTGTIQTFTQKLINKKPFSFIKIGDDCVFCVQGQKGANAENHPYSPELAHHMREAYEYCIRRPQDIHVAEWNNSKLWYFDALLMHEDRFLTDDLKNFYRILKNDSRPKYYFARDRMREASKVFNMEFIEVPYPNSYSHIAEVMEKVKEIARPDIIILFSCGMLSKIMVYECHKICPEMTVLDMGSAFDPLFVGDTRSNEPGQHLKVKEFMKELL